MKEKERGEDMEKREQRLLVTAEGCRAAVALQARENTGYGQGREAAGRGRKQAEAGGWQEIVRTSGWIGRNGLGKQREGDGRTPVEGFFLYGFGLKENPGTVFPYIQVDESYYLVDDPDSRYYNQLVSTREVSQDWRSAEHIVEMGAAYNYVLVTDYNKAGMPGIGSGIFLHCEEGKPTAGCIAVPEPAMKEIMKKMQTDCRLVCERGNSIWL